MRSAHAPRGISRRAVWSRATTAMDAPVPMEPNLAAAVVPEREPTVVMENTIVPEVPENGTTAEEAPVPKPAPTGARKVSRPVQPPQKGTTLFPIARVSKIIKVCISGIDGRRTVPWTFAAKKRPFSSVPPPYVHSD